MAGFAAAPEPRDQIVLFSQKLDEVIPADHRVRLLEDILGRIDWSEWEACYNLHLGQPPIPPRVLASAILYGILNRILSSRLLEEALVVRNDFRWLAEGRTIDHTTICTFRRSNSKDLKRLFVQIGLIARELGYLSLESLGFDGTRMRANNRRSGTRTPAELRAAEKELFKQQFEESEAKTAAADASDDEQMGSQSRCRLPKDLAEAKLRQKKIAAALAELEQCEKEPARIPITDPESRVTPNKDGGFAPNYTPHATVDIDSGLVVSADVIAHTDEDKHMLAAIDDVKESFGLEHDPKEMLADGMMCTGENLAACEERGIDFYSPISLGSEDNPAEREDPSQPVAPEDWDRLPTRTSKHKDGTRTSKLDKNAFVYDEENDCYWCPSGKRLNYERQTTEMANGRRRVRYRYRSEASDCAGCPLRDRCLGAKSKTRQVIHEQHEAKRRAHAKKMKQADAKEKYARRRHPGERPFAVIKAKYGARQFGSRGLSRVRNEWLWLVSAFNLDRLLSLISSSGLDPPVRIATS